MPQSIVRFLRVYASVVMLLAAGAMAIGTEPAAAPADFGNVEAASAHATSRRAIRIVSFHGNGHDARFSFAAFEASALRGALPLSTSAIGNANLKTCAKRGLRIRHQS